MISPEAKTRDPIKVNQMFGAIARRYDLANHVLSFGFDFYWRRRAVEIVAGWKPNKVLDLAAGTGDLALALQNRLRGVEIIAADFSAEMLAIAREKGVANIQLADAAELPFAVESFDCVSIAFGLRNLPDWNAGIREMSRVLSSGGHLLVLDFSLPENPILRALYRFYLHSCVPLIAGAVTKNRDAYEYLGGSIEEFPNGEAMCRLIESNGFRDVRFVPLTGGIVTIYTATKGRGD